jgi:hypothetical protein
MNWLHNNQYKGSKINRKLVTIMLFLLRYNALALRRTGSEPHNQPPVRLLPLRIPTHQKPHWTPHPEVKKQLWPNPKCVTRNYTKQNPTKNEFNAFVI